MYTERGKTASCVAHGSGSYQEIKKGIERFSAFCAKHKHKSNFRIVIHPE